MRTHRNAKLGLAGRFALVCMIESGSSLRDELIRAEGISDELTSEEIDRALDPAGYLGSADAFIDRALSRYREGS